MGNYKFKLSDMIPNAWFYKLKDMGNIGKSRSKSRSKSKSQSQSQTININSPRRRSHHHHHHHHHSRRRASPLNSPKPSSILLSTPPQKPQLLPKRASFYVSSSPTKKKLLFSPSPTSPPSPPRRSKKNSRVRPIRPKKPTIVAVPWDLPSPSPKRPSSRHLRNLYAGDVEREFEESDDKEEEEEEAHERPIKAHQDYAYCKVTSSATDIIIDVSSSSSNSSSSRSTSGASAKLGADFNELELPPIITKSATRREGDACQPEDKHVVDAAERRRRRGEEGAHSGGGRPRRSNYAGLQRLRARANTPRVLSGAKIQARVSTPPTPTKRALKQERASGTNSIRNNCYREGFVAQKSLGGSFVVVKSSTDPQRDFKESMVEMIVENKLRNSKDLEDLLACYLSLNSDEYHDVIVKVFEQIWFHLNFR